MAVVNELKTREDIINYKKWMSNKGIGQLKMICRMIETDERIRPGRWKKAQLRIELIKSEISSRKPTYKKEGIR